jgi:hypothetical protein
MFCKVEDNTSLPVTISSVRVLHANRTRRSFLERVVEPLLSANRSEPYTLEEALKEVGEATDKLNRFGRTPHLPCPPAFTWLTANRHLQVANLSLPRPTKPDHCHFLVYRRRCLHLCSRARHLHHQDGYRGRCFGSRRLCPRRAPEPVWRSRDGQRTRIARHTNTLSLFPRL